MPTGEVVKVRQTRKSIENSVTGINSTSSAAATATINTTKPIVPSRDLTIKGATEKLTAIKSAKDIALAKFLIKADAFQVLDLPEFKVIDCFLKSLMLFIKITYASNNGCNNFFIAHTNSLHEPFPILICHYVTIIENLCFGVHISFISLLFAETKLTIIVLNLFENLINFEFSVSNKISIVSTYSDFFNALLKCALIF